MNYIFTPPKSTSIRHKLISPQRTPSQYCNGHSFRPNEFILENGVIDFTDDLSVEEPNEHNNFLNILIGDVPSKFQFEDNFSGEEDAVLNNPNSSETSTPLMPNNNLCPPTPKTSVSDDGNKSTVNLTHSSHDEQIEESGSNSNIYSDSNSTSVSSFFSDSSSHSVSHTKPWKFEKVKLNQAIMDKAPVKIVDEIPWNINSNVVYKIKCTE